jgi:acetyl-CoA C-acetyltransferase
MGSAAEICAKECGISRQAQDAFARQSYERALAAQKAGTFKDEIVPGPVPQKKGDPVIFDVDEEPGRWQPTKIAPCGRPSKRRHGDGRQREQHQRRRRRPRVDRDYARQHGLPILGRITGYGAARPGPRVVHHRPGLRHQQDPRASSGPHPRRHRPVRDQRGLLGGLPRGQQIAKLPAERVNVNGGAVALGHPIGASGAASW